MADDPAEAAALSELEKAILDFQSKARTLQIHLQAEGLYQGEIDGHWGPQSQTALRKYTRRQQRLLRKKRRAVRA